MLEQLKIDSILFLDIETVPLFPEYDSVPPALRALWDKKASYLRKEQETPEEIYGRAGIYAEFGKIICICTGMIRLQEGKRTLRLKSYYGHEEKEFLRSFAEMVSQLALKREILLCAHNGKEFDFPFISRRLLISGLPLPVLFDMAGRKPWETRHIDTLELWKFGDHKHYTSLELLTNVFGIESPKGDMDGSQVAHVYWQDGDLERIVTYCRRDVVSIAQLMLRFKGEPLLEPENIVVLDV